MRWRRTSQARMRRFLRHTMQSSVDKRSAGAPAERGNIIPLAPWCGLNGDDGAVHVASRHCGGLRLPLRPARGNYEALRDAGLGCATAAVEQTTVLFTKDLSCDRRGISFLLVAILGHQATTCLIRKQRTRRNTLCWVRLTNRCISLIKRETEPLPRSQHLPG